MNSSRRLERLQAAAPYLAILLTVVYSTREVLGALSQRVIGLTDTHWVEGVMWWYWNITNNPWRGISPLTNDLHAYPVGFNHYAQVGSFGDAVSSAPFFLSLEVPASYNLTLFAFLCFNAMAAYLFFHRWWGGRVLPTLFALAYTFHPLFHFFVEEGRPTQLVFGWVFLALAGARPLVDDPHRGSIRLLVLGLVGSFLCFWFNGFFLYLLLPAVWLAAAREMEPPARRALARRGAKALVLGAALAFPFGLPLLGDALSGEGIKGVGMFNLPSVWHHSWFSARPWEVFLPQSPFNMVLPYVTIGLALVALVVWGLAWRRGEGRTALGASTPGFLVGGALFYVLTLGPYLRLGQTTLQIGEYYPALPWAWLHWGLPFYSRLSYPYLVFPFLLIVVFFLCGRFLTRATRGGGWRRSMGWIVGAALLLEVLFRGGLTVISSPFAVPEYYRGLRDEPGVRAIIEYPFGAADFRHVYQSVHLKPMINSRGSEMGILIGRPRLERLFRETAALGTLMAYQRQGHPLHVTAADRQKLIKIGFDRLIVSDQARRRSSRLRNMPMDQLCAELATVFGQPYHRTPTLVAFRIQP